MEQDLFNSGYGELVSVLQLSGESERGAKILMPATVRPLLTSALQQRRAICSQGTMIHWNIVLKGVLKSNGLIPLFGLRSEKRGAIYDNLLVDLQGSPAFDFVVFVVFLLLWFSLID